MFFFGVFFYYPHCQDWQIFSPIPQAHLYSLCALFPLLHGGSDVWGHPACPCLLLLLALSVSCPKAEVKEVLHHFCF